MYEVVYATVAVRLRGIRRDDERKGGGTMKESMNDVPHPKKALWWTRGTFVLRPIREEERV